MHAFTALLALGLAGLSVANEAPTGSWKDGKGATVVSFLTKVNPVNLFSNFKTHVC